MKRDNMKHWSLQMAVTTLLGILAPLCTMGQANGVVIEVDTAFYGVNTPTPEDGFDVEGVLDGYVSYIVYATFDSPTDVLSALFSDISALPDGGAMGINAPCGCFNISANNMVMDATNSSVLWGFPAGQLYQYDTFWTIGMMSGDAPGQLPTFISTPPVNGTEICDSQLANGSVFITGSEGNWPVNAVAGDDLKVEIARVTTCGDWSMNVNLQVFVGGSQEEVQQFFVDVEYGGELEVEDPCEDYATVDPTFDGLTTQCAGLQTEVLMQDLGAEDVSTTYSLFQSNDGFVEDIQEVYETSTSAFPGLTAGDYQVLVADEYGCYDTAFFAVSAPDSIVALISLVDDNACFGEASAVIELPDSSFYGGTGDLTVEAKDPLGNVVPFTEGPDNLLVWDNLVCIEGDGTFTFVVEDESGCQVLDTLVVNCPEAIEVEFFSGDVVCAGDADGFIVADASGGSGDLFLTIQTETVPLSEGFMDLGPGTYLAAVVDEFDCSSTQLLVDIQEPDPVSVTVLGTSPISCGLECNGAVTLDYSGGLGGLDVSYFNVNQLQEFPDSVDLCFGEYVVTVVDTAGCTSTAEFLIESNAPLDFLVETTNVTCTGMSDGTADVFPIGGEVSGPNEYDWVVIDTAGFVANLDNLSEMTYTALVTDQIGCSYSETFSIGVENVTDMTLAVFASPVTCWNAADGTATVSVNGGEAPFLYAWSDPFSQTAATAVGLTESTYTVTVTDALGCRRTASQAIETVEGCLFIADALTPNGDLVNDEWVVGGLEDFPESVLQVFNRWGQKMFETTGGAERWDGRFAGNRLPVADYYYTIQLTPDSSPIRGTVTLKY